MKSTIAGFFFLVSAAFISAQTTGSVKTVRAGDSVSAQTARTVEPASPPDYVVIGANFHEEELIRSEISRIHPAVLPLRIIFVPHWKYLDNARIFQLHVPKGYSSAMFTHLLSRTTFIDSDRYLGDEYLRHYFAHELGHLVTNSAKEEDAERAAREFRTVPLCRAPVCAPQQEIAGGSKGDFLPPTTGEPLTVAPSDKPDVNCSIVDWIGEPAKPTLTLLCPPEEVFAPLHVYLKVSWVKAEDVPAYTRAIRAPARTLTKLRTNKTVVWIWLGVQEKQGAPPRKKWVPFSGVVDVALLTLSAKH